MLHEWTSHFHPTRTASKPPCDVGQPIQPDFEPAADDRPGPEHATVFHSSRLHPFLADIRWFASFTVAITRSHTLAEKIEDHDKYEDTDG